MRELEKNRVLNTLQELDRRVIPAPMAVIYRKPKEFPENYVVKIFDAKTGRPTCLIIRRKTLDECREDIKKSGFGTSFPKAAADDSVIIESWI